MAKLRILPLVVLLLALASALGTLDPEAETAASRPAPASDAQPLGVGDSCRDYASAPGSQSIPDPGMLIANLSVPDSLTVSSVQVTVNITHPSDGELDVFLRSPAGTLVELFSGVGGAGANFVNTTLNDAAATSITAGAAPFTGSFRPEGSLADLAGLTFAGTWQLRVTDGAAPNSGTLNSWSLTLCSSILNDAFSDAVDISDPPSTYAQYTESATTAFDDPVVDCNGTASTHSRSVWFRLQLPVGAVAEITTNGSSYDTVLAVFTGTAGALTQVACNDNGGIGLQSTVGPLFVHAGATYYIEAVDFNLSGGSLLLTMTANSNGDPDGDGCTNGQELGPLPVLGGGRDPFIYWDFFDTPNAANARDAAITAGDLARVVERFGSSGDKTVDPMSAPPAPPAYHPAFDRSPPGTAPNAQEQGPNGSVTAQDIAVIVSQFGHTCA
ncbi:MAG: flexitail domain-containing putative surface protein [Dehalococcoidia bacterium]